jgi:hypothetical protein
MEAELEAMLGVTPAVPEVKKEVGGGAAIKPEMEPAVAELCVKHSEFLKKMAGLQVGRAFW